MTNLLVDIGFIIVLATVLAYAARYLKQPILVAYVLSGIIIGPIGLGLITDISDIYLLAEFGVAFLLFTIGLEIDVHKLRSVGKPSLVGGFIQVGITFVLGFFLAILLGLGSTLAIYIGSLIAFSSTMIVAKLLVDSDEINTLHGRIMIGILIIQDLLVILIIPVLKSINGLFSFDIFLGSVLNGVGLFAIAIVLNRFVFRSLLEKAARSGEILFLTTISVCFAFIGASVVLDFPIAIGAFFGGLALAKSPYNTEIYGKMRSLRDFFLVIFFATLGIQLDLSALSTMFTEFIVILLVIVLIKPIILVLTYLFMGYGGRTSSAVGLGMGQASEFSFIIASIGLWEFGHLSHEAYSLIISLIVVSMIITPYFVKFRKGIYYLFSDWHIPGKKRLRVPKNLQKMYYKPEGSLEKHVIVIGTDTMGKRVIDYLKDKKVKFIVADHNPEIIKKLTQSGVYALYGDAGNEDLLKELGLYRAKMAILTIPDTDLSGFVINKAKRFNPDIKIFAKAPSEEKAQDLYLDGADFVVVPEYVSGGTIIRKIESTLGRKRNHHLFKHLDVKKNGKD
jgi:Kef-type K+ transport system membrane component KefB